MVRWICTTLNALLFTAILIYVLAEPDLGPTGHREELTFYFLFALFFASVAAGLFMRKRWLVVVPSIPVILAGVLLALFMAAGGWIRGPSSAAATTTLILSGLGVTLLELIAIVAARKFAGSTDSTAITPPS